MVRLFGRLSGCHSLWLRGPGSPTATTTSNNRNKSSDSNEEDARQAEVFFSRLRSFLRYRGQNIAIGGLVDIDLNHKAAAFIDATDELVDKWTRRQSDAHLFLAQR